MPVVKNVTEQVKGSKSAANVGDAAAEFDIEKGRVKLRNAAVSSPVVGLQGGGTMQLDGSEVDLRVVAAPLADWRDNLKSTKIPIVSNVAGELAGGLQKMLNAATGALLYEFRVQGSVEKPEVIAVPTPVLTDTAAFVFERMLAPPKKDQRPIDSSAANANEQRTSPARPRGNAMNESIARTSSARRPARHTRASARHVIPSGVIRPEGSRGGESLSTPEIPRSLKLPRG